MEEVEEIKGGIPLETLADVRRAMAKDIRRLRAKTLDVKLGNALMFAYTQLAHLLQDKRDHVYQKRLKVLWEAHQRGQGLAPEADEVDVQ